MKREQEAQEIVLTGSLHVRNHESVADGPRVQLLINLKNDKLEMMSEPFKRAEMEGTNRRPFCKIHIFPLRRAGSQSVPRSAAATDNEVLSRIDEVFVGVTDLPPFSTYLKSSRTAPLKANWPPNLNTEIEEAFDNDRGGRRSSYFNAH